MAIVRVYYCLGCGMILKFLPTDKHCPMCKTRIRNQMNLDTTLIPIPEELENVNTGNVSEIDPNIKD